MGIRDIFKRRRTRKSANILDVIMSSVQDDSERQLSQREILQHGFMGTSGIYKAIDLLAESASRIRVIIVDEKGSEVTTDNKAAKWLEQPRQGMTIEDFVYEFVTIFKVYGEWYAEILDTSLEEVWLLKPPLMQIIQGTGFQNRTQPAFTYGSSQRKIESETLLSIKNYNPDYPDRGLSPLIPASQSIRQARAAGVYNTSSLKNKGIPGGIVTIDPDKMDEPTDEQMIALTRRIEENLQGAQNAGRFTAMYGAYDLKLFEGNHELSFMDTMVWLTREFATLIKVDPGLIGDVEQKNYANHREARKALYEEGAIPTLNRLLAELNRRLMPVLEPNRRYYFAMDTSDIQALREDENQLFKRVDDASFLTINEKRRAAGYKDIDDGDRLQEKIVHTGTATEQKKLGKQVKKADADSEYIERLESMREREEAKATKTIAKLFEAEGKQVREAVENAATVSLARLAIMQTINRNRQEWEDAYREMYVNAAEPFAKETLDYIGTLDASKNQQTQSGRPWQRQVADVIDKVAAAKVVGIQDATLADMRRVLDEAIDNGDSVETIAETISAKYSTEYTVTRATRIARTEVVSASNQGTVAAARETGRSLNKRWKATSDNRTRDDHQAADGQVVGLESPFTVNGENLDTPGDPAGSPGNVINCRCAVIIQPDRS